MIAHYQEHAFQQKEEECDNEGDKQLTLRKEQEEGWKKFQQLSRLDEGSSV